MEQRGAFPVAQGVQITTTERPTVKTTLTTDFDTRTVELNLCVFWGLKGGETQDDDCVGSSSNPLKESQRKVENAAAATAAAAAAQTQHSV